jgi:hypothetical protein
VTGSPAELIRRKRDGGALTDDELAGLVAGILDDSVEGTERARQEWPRWTPAACRPVITTSPPAYWWELTAEDPRPGGAGPAHSADVHLVPNRRSPASPSPGTM